jgi:NAD kinase
MDYHSKVIDKSVEIFVERAKHKVHLVNFEWQNYYKTIRNKLMWGEDKRN